MRRAAIRRSLEWIIARQEADGCWGGIQPPWVYSLIALRLLGFGAAVRQAGANAEPHLLASFLFEVASSFTAFYEQCPVLIAETPELRDSRLRLSAIVLEVLQAGLGVLGIRVPERM